MNKEKVVRVQSGAYMLGWAILGLPLLIAASVYMGNQAEQGNAIGNSVLIWLSIGLLFLWWCISLAGFFVVEPNGSKVLILFGSYKGTVRDSGFYWTNPFMSKRSVSLRARSLNGERLKVNDHDGNPVEIAAIVVWAVNDTFEALFEVDNYEQYVSLQSETAVRHLAQSFPYDADDAQISLRKNTDEICDKLKDELDQRLRMAGVRILEARLAHLAYAQEIAGAMLRRQQAAAVIAARQMIVEGAVGMVELAVDRLAQHESLTLDEDRKASMVSNLMVVLCSDHSVQPVLNTGTLYP